MPACRFVLTEMGNCEYHPAFSYQRNGPPAVLEHQAVFHLSRVSTVAPDMQRARRRLRRHLWVMGGCTLAGAAIAFSVMPFLAGILPTDLSRSSRILEAERTVAGKPEICFFGNSVVMNGLDAKRLSEALPEHPEIWNLSSTGQQLWESVLLQQDLPDSVQVVVQGVFANTLEEPPNIPPNKYNALVMYGFRPDEQTRRWAESYLDAASRDYFFASPLRHRFDARWMLSGWFNTWVRSALRSDLTVDRAQTDLYYPRAYTRKVSDSALKHQLEKYIAGHPPGEFHPDPQTEALLVELAESYRRRGIRFVLWILPRHPEYSRRALGDEFKRGLADYLTRLQVDHGITVVNTLDSLPAERFVDGSHPDDIGAAILSQTFAADLKDVAICSSTRPSSSSLR
ncbi:MAG: hypothetical protein D6741_10320 [Planctomycetota bacterium]|nr:MAG: hypothetical protein D6741_10320 [Planctomycetota bacterium]